MKQDGRAFPETCPLLWYSQGETNVAILHVKVALLDDSRVAWRQHEVVVRPGERFPFNRLPVRLPIPGAVIIEYGFGIQAGADSDVPVSDFLPQDFRQSARIGERLPAVYMPNGKSDT